MNRLSKNNYMAESLIIKSFNHEVLCNNIIDRICKGHGDLEMLVQLALETGMDLKLLSDKYDAFLASGAPRNVNAIHNMSLMILNGIYQAPLLETFQRFAKLYEGNDVLLAEFLNGFVSRIELFHDGCVILKEQILAMAEAIFGRSKFGSAKWIAHDVVEAFKALQ